MELDGGGIASDMLGVLSLVTSVVHILKKHPDLEE